MESRLVLLKSMACGAFFVAYDVSAIPDYGDNNPDRNRIKQKLHPATGFCS